MEPMIVVYFCFFGIQYPNLNLKQSFRSRENYLKQLICMKVLIESESGKQRVEGA